MKLFRRKEPQSKCLVIGLGNHGARYKNNRHNIGFMIVDQLAVSWGLSIAKKQSRAKVVTHKVFDSQVILAKPQTFMNESGRAVQALLSYYKITPVQMIVLFDDLDLPLGTIRMRPFGGTGGHRGMRSIQNAIQSQDYPRMRVGIGRPSGRMDPAAYVLQDFSHNERDLVETTIDRAVDCLQRYLEHGIEDAMNMCNTSVEIP